MDRASNSTHSRTRSIRRGTELDRRIRAEMRAERRAASDARPFGALRRRLSWPVAIIGGIVFVASYVGSMTGTVILPFDSHHIVGQLGGGALAVFGVVSATSARTALRR